MDYKINAKNKRFGRLASEIAVILLGKKNADYAPHKVSDDRVLLSNYKNLEISGNKYKEKIYYRNTGYMGHLKEATFEQAFTKNPKTVLREAVRRMLPKNFLNAQRLKNLIFVDHD